MKQFFLQVIPVVALFFVGILLKWTKVLVKSDGDALLRLSFNVSLPAMTLLSMKRITLHLQLLYLPLAAASAMAITFIVATIVSKWVKMDRKQQGTFFLGCMIMNTAFTHPFFLAAYAEEGLVRSALFDLGNVFLIFTLTYYIAVRYGQNKSGNNNVWKKIATLPPLWALTVGLILNLGNIPIPKAIDNLLQLTGNTTIPLVMIALGLYFQPKVQNIKKIALVHVIRIIGGLLSGILFTKIFGLTGFTAKIIIAGSAAPIGYNTLVLSQLEGLDTEFAASLVSVSILLGIVYLPLLILIMW